MTQKIEEKTSKLKTNKHEKIGNETVIENFEKSS